MKATHALTSVVFPKPAGAAMRVSLRCRPSFSRSSRRGRLTTFGRSRGRYSFVARMGVTLSLLQRLPRSFHTRPIVGRPRGSEFCASLEMIFQPEEESLFELATEWLPDRGSRARLEAGNPLRNGATCNVEEINAFDSRYDHHSPSCTSGR